MISRPVSMLQKAIEGMAGVELIVRVNLRERTGIIVKVSAGTTIFIRRFALLTASRGTHFPTTHKKACTTMSLLIYFEDFDGKRFK